MMQARVFETTRKLSADVSSIAEPVPIVLLHGWGVDGQVWQSLVPYLQTIAQVHVIDIDYIVDDIDILCEHIQHLLPSHCVVMGWSLGGMLATRIAARFPDQVCGLVTLATNKQFVADDEYSAAMSPAIFDGFVSALSDNPTKTLKRFMSLVIKGDDCYRDQRDYLQSLDMNVTATGNLLKGLMLLANSNNTHCLSLIKCPVLHCFGQHDHLVPVAAIDDLKALCSQHRFHLLENTGHLLYSPASRLIDVLDTFFNEAIGLK